MRGSDSTENHYCFFCQYPHWKGCSIHHNHDSGDEDDGEAKFWEALARGDHEPYRGFKTLDGHRVIYRKGVIACAEGL